jgi:hypothetical protein
MRKLLITAAAAGIAFAPFTVFTASVAFASPVSCVGLPPSAYEDCLRHIIESAPVQEQAPDIVVPSGGTPPAAPPPCAWYNPFCKPLPRCGPNTFDKNGNLIIPGGCTP